MKACPQGEEPRTTVASLANDERVDGMGRIGHILMAICSGTSEIGGRHDPSSLLGLEK